MLKKPLAKMNYKVVLPATSGEFALESFNGV